MQRFRKSVLIVLIIVIALFAFLTWYKFKYAMDIAEAREINTTSAPIHLLIATQGSDFKEQIVERVINEFKSDSIYIKVIDVTSLPDLFETSWNAVFIMHTWENWEPQEDAASFIKNWDDKSKLVVLATSGDGGYVIEGIDGISAASLPEQVDAKSKEVIDRLKPLLSSTAP